HPRRRRLPLVPGPRRRLVQGGRLPHRAERNRELPGQARPVVNAAVVPKPDAERGAVVKAYVVLAPQAIAARGAGRKAARFDAELVAELQLHVKGKLAPYEYPKEIEFIE